MVINVTSHKSHVIQFEAVYAGLMTPLQRTAVRSAFSTAAAVTAAHNKLLE